MSHSPGWISAPNNPKAARPNQFGGIGMPKGRALNAAAEIGRFALHGVPSGAAIERNAGGTKLEIGGLADRDAHLEFEHVGGHGILVTDEAGLERGAAGHVLGLRMPVRLDHQRFRGARRQQRGHARLRDA